MARSEILSPQAQIETRHATAFTAEQVLFMGLDNASDPFDKANTVKKNLSKLAGNPVGLVNYLVHARVAENPYLQYGETIVLNHYNLLTQEENHGEANAIARIMIDKRDAIVNPANETEAYREFQHDSWVRREQKSFIKHTDKFLTESEEVRPDDYKLRIFKLYDNVWEREDIGNASGFPRELAQKVTVRVIEQYIDMGEPQYAFSEAAQTGMGNKDTRVHALFREHGLEEAWREYRIQQERKEKIRINKRRIGY